MSGTVSSHVERLRSARVLLALGELNEAEAGVAEVLEHEPEHPAGLGLLAKIKHMRGELSLTIACVSQRESQRNSTRPAARAHLEAMLRLAQDPQHGTGEFIALGEFQLVKKPAAYLALERAFRLFVDRQPTRARGVCRQVAARYLSIDPEIHRLAMLAEAWIGEMIGDLDAACQCLERLGQERGLEMDVDRMLALVGLYERIGTPERLAAAVNIYRHLENALEHHVVVGRLASLHRRLNQEDDAHRLEQEHARAYLRAQHGIDCTDLLETASHHYLPLDALRRVRVEPLPPAADWSPRQRALGFVLADDYPAARTLLDEADPLDLAYLADLEFLEHGPTGAATSLYTRALRANPGDRHLIARLLGVDSGFDPAALRRLFGDHRVARESLETLERAVAAAPHDPVLWRLLSALFGMQPGGEEQHEQFSERAAMLEAAAGDGARTSGRSLSAAVYRLFGAVQGLIHEVWATRQLTGEGQGAGLQHEDVLGNLTPEMRNDVRGIFFAVLQYAQTKFPHVTRDILEHRYVFKVSKEDEPSGGVSAGLPTALAFLSVFLQRPLPADVASTGAIVADSHDVLMVRPVGDIEPKVDAAVHRNLRMILVPTGNLAQLEQGAWVPGGVIRELVRPVSSLDEAVRLVFGEKAFL